MSTTTWKDTSRASLSAAGNSITYSANQAYKYGVRALRTGAATRHAGGSSEGEGTTVTSIVTQKIVGAVHAAANVVRGVAGRAAHTRALVIDRVRGLRTSDVIALEQLGVEHPDRVQHVASPWGALKRVLDSSEVGPDDVFIDIGSGLGRVLYLAARYPFARVEGLEISGRLAALSRTNIERARKKLRCQDVQIVTGDLVDYELPGDATYIYLFNPFQRLIFEAFLEKLFESLDRHAREITLIYLHPVEHDLVIGSGRARLIKVHRGSRFLPGPREPQTVHVYRLS